MQKLGLSNLRRQNPVGQGFFHSAFLLEEGDLRLSYVYDCGAMAKYSDAREREIDKFEAVAKTYSVKKLDILCLSHVHADHVNGIERLLQSLKVDTIMLPLLNVADRLIAYGRTAVEDPASAQSGFYRDFIVDPAAALGRFEPRQILFVEPGGEGGAPGGGDGPIEPSAGPGGGLRDKVSSGEHGSSWFLVGRGEPRFAQNQSDSSAVAAVIPDTMAMMITAMATATGAKIGGSRGAWLLAPYIDTMVESQRKRFLRALAKQCKMTIKLLENWLLSTANIQDLVVNKVDRLAAAYAMIASNLNVTSMSLYSGPARSIASGEPRSWTSLVGGVSCQWSSVRIAWLATGDAALKQSQRRNDLLSHYAQLLEQVITLTLPHHGSDHNFHVDLLKGVQPSLCVAAADSYSTWKHPGAHTVQAVCSHPALLQVVTSKKASRVWELASLG
ncbi:MAG TPA: MBL fold metallo-hydrolase [Allosphingosinicella sp.]